MLTTILDSIATEATKTHRPSWKPLSDVPNFDGLTDGVLLRDYCEDSLSLKYERPTNIQDGPWIWWSKGPEEEQFGELRCFIMGGRIALVLWATQWHGKKHLERLTEFHSLADIRYDIIDQWIY